MPRSYIARWLTSFVLFCFLATPALAREGAAPGQDAAQPNAGLLTVTGRVIMPDGSPVAGATVAASGDAEGASSSAHADNGGAFQLRGVFGNGARLYASSVDGKHQTTLMVSSGSARTTFASSTTLTLTPAVTHLVTVLSDGRPVKAAHVMAQGTGFKVRGVTDNDGKAQIRLPANERIRDVAAWHPQLGVAGAQERLERPPQNQTTLSLLPPAPHTVRVVDQYGRGVAGLVLGASVRTEDSTWIASKDIEAAHFQTDADGSAFLSWMPREKLKYIDVDIIGADWKIDNTDLKSTGNGRTTVAVRRKISVAGRLIVPDGANAEGILITGFGFGSKGRGDIPYARARRDGTFTLQVPSDHGYVLGITDIESASKNWSGMILETDRAKPAEIKIETYPASRVTIQVTRGSDPVPVEGAWVEISTPAEVAWVNGSGQKQTGSANVASWLRTNADGIEQAGVGLGPQRIRLNSGNWNEERTIEVTSNERVVVKFHREWLGNRRVTGRLLIDGQRYKPSSTIVARAWTARGAPNHSPFEPVVRSDGTFDVAFDAKDALLLFVDHDRRLSAFAQIGPADSTVDLAMLPTATYSGSLLDETARPWADGTLRLSVADSPYEAISPQQTDAAGHFRFAVVPADVPLKLSLGDERAFRHIVAGDRTFKPAEVRENDTVRSDHAGSSRPIIQPSITLTESVTRLCRDARLNGMHGLVILQGEDSPRVARMARRVLDSDEVPDVLAFVALRVEAAQLEAEATKVADYGWPKPAPGETVVVALGGDQKTIATLRINVDDAAASRILTAAFLSQHRPPRRDAAMMLQEAQTEAAASGRRVWIVASGPRCEPCYRLARWMDDHRMALKKDYVLVKLMEALDEHVAEVLDKLQRPEPGIPWYAITAPDGKVLTTSDGPLGNIGMPGFDVGIRHFREMLDRTAQRLTSADKDALIKSLSPGQ